MAIPLVQVRHKKTGRKTFLPETALRNFPDYVKTPSQKSREEVPDGTAYPADVAARAETDQKPAANSSESPATTTKEK